MKIAFAFAFIVAVAIISTLLATYSKPSKKIHSEKCEDGYFGDPAGKLGAVRQCQKCDCNKNINLGVHGNCDTTTGMCLKCIRNTGGANCEKCRLGFFGDALITQLSTYSPSCQPCKCNPNGSLYYPQNILPRCDPNTGVCVCKPHVEGHDCSRCENGYVNIENGNGCEPCYCNLKGSYGTTCHQKNGACNCKPHVIGHHCDMCEEGYFNIESGLGCNKLCNCDSYGSYNKKCHAKTGACKYTNSSTCVAIICL